MNAFENHKQINQARAHAAPAQNWNYANLFENIQLSNSIRQADFDNI